MRYEKHGLSYHPLYRTWTSMLNRCRNRNATQWKWYGGRGIKVCRRWLSFPNFLADMGARPRGAQLDRKHNDGNYEPGNCRGATKGDQMNNMTSNRLLKVSGEVMTLAEAARRYRLTPDTISQRIDKLGWSATRAATTPKGSTFYRYLTVNGKRVQLRDAAARLGCAPTVISIRIDRLGWTETKAATVPARRHQLRNQAP